MAQGYTTGIPISINTSLSPGSNNLVPSQLAVKTYVDASKFPWSDTSGSVTASVKNGYFITATCTSTLPASPSEGDSVRYIVDTTNILTITGNTGQKIRIGTTLSAAAGTAVNTQRGDSLELIYRSTGTTWFCASGSGGWTVT